MDLNKLKLKAKFFKALKGLSKEDKHRYLQNCPKEAIETMCEACFNLLKHEKLKNKKSLNKKLKPFYSLVKTLGNKGLSVNRKRELLDDTNIVCGITSAIGENIIPLLNSFIRHGASCNKIKKHKKKTQNKSKK